jgi:hypothetical protein
MAFAYSDLQDPFGQVLAVTPADALLPGGLTRGLLVNVTTAGNIAIVTNSGDAVVIALPIGFFNLPIRARQVSATGTTVLGNIYAGY